MKFRLLHIISLSFLFAGLGSCVKNTNTETITDPNSLPTDIQAQIEALGFHAEGGYATEGGYIVENDIFLTDEDLKKVDPLQKLIVGNTEQYRTTNLVTGLPRNITVWISSQLPASYVACLDIAIGRYNAENLQLSFTRVSSSSGSNIKIKKAPNGAGYLASAGFPSGGNPYGQVLVNSAYIGSNPNQNYLGTILAHEMGHCIGFRHTDYMDRSYSCGGSYYNEGSGGVGAIHIPGTPTGPDANSWMLACIGTNQNRPFNNNDKTALNYLY